MNSEREEIYPSLYTIGYQGREIREFIDILQRHNITCLIDVREVPFSRKPGFSKKKLSEYLASVGIKYIHAKELGSPASLREKLKQDGDDEYFIEKYKEYLLTQMDVVQELYKDFISKDHCCLMCMERNPDHCHRRIIAEKMMEVSGEAIRAIHI